MPRGAVAVGSTLLLLAAPRAVVTGPVAAIVDLPMQFRGLEPAVDVMVNGQGPFLFAIDTGATDDARVDSSLIARLNLRISGTDRVGDGSSAKKRTVGTVLLDSLSIGGLEFQHSGSFLNPVLGQRARTCF